MVTMSTVGYGDLSPSTPFTKFFTVLMILFGIAGVFRAVASAVDELTGPITQRGRVLLERLFPQKGVDILGDGVVDYYEPGSELVYYGTNLLPSILLTCVVQLLSAAVFTQVNGGPEWSFGNALYHCLVTATTVGYGDVPNYTLAGRQWACVHILVSVAMLGEMIQTFHKLQRQRVRTLERIARFKRDIDEAFLEGLIGRAKLMRPKVKRDGKGLTELEFVLAMTLELGLVKWEQIKPFIKQFRQYDIDGNARLGRDDLQLLKGQRAMRWKKAGGLWRSENSLSVERREGVKFEREPTGPDVKGTVGYLSRSASKTASDASRRDGEEAASPSAAQPEPSAAVSEEP